MHLPSLKNFDPNTRRLLPLQSYEHIIANPDKRISFEKWIKKFHNVLEKFKINGAVDDIIRKNKLFGESTSISEFQSWVNEIPLRELPTEELIDDILDEIDNNLKDFESERKKLKFLEAIKNEFLIYRYDFSNKAEYFAELQIECNHPDIENKENYLERFNDLIDDYVNRHNLTLSDLIITSLLWQVRVLDYIIDYIDKKKTPTEIQEKFEYESLAQSHRLVIMYRLGLFEPLVKNYFNKISRAKFTYLIGTILGVSEAHLEGFKRTVGDLVNEIDNPNILVRTKTKNALNNASSFFAKLGINPDNTEK